MEAPFVGREREMLLIKQLFHSSAEDRRAHLVSATGIAGIGKSRVGWEFFKYIDGLAKNLVAPGAQSLLWGRDHLLGAG
ncbi:MAG: ATP-binding protein [Actinomycetota bacterium]|nr:ATP-binding protein [Actinomycetota bacterium]